MKRRYNRAPAFERSCAKPPYHWYCGLLPPRRHRPNGRAAKSLQ
jgi:hypothetical protein